jgi:hypothetical protein
MQRLLGALLICVAFAAACSSGSAPLSVQSSAETDPCAGKPEGWPATKDEIRAGFASADYKTRECASLRIRQRICSSYDVTLKGWLQELSVDSDPEVAKRASDALALIGTPSVSLGGSVPPDGSLNVQGYHVSSCEVWTHDDAVEPIYQVLQPASPDNCGNGDINQNLTFTCPPYDVTAEVTCHSSDGRTQTSTMKICAAPAASPTPGQTATPGPTQTATPAPSATPGPI